MKIQPVRGTHDLHGSELDKFNYIEKMIKDISSAFGFDEITTPIFESSNLFKKPLGEQSDVVLKEMYTFLDKNDSFLTLRPEYTTPIIRAAISNNLINRLPTKLFGFGPMFRRERPQKGRYRQFNQINFENFGSDDFFADIEIINLANILLKKLIPKILIICNPNNPTGTILSVKNILNLTRNHPETLVVIDELYEAFLGESVLPRVNYSEISNLIVLRSLSKTSLRAASTSSRR